MAGNRAENMEFVEIMRSKKWLKGNHLQAIEVKLVNLHFTFIMIPSVQIEIEIE